MGCLNRLGFCADAKKTYKWISVSLFVADGGFQDLMSWQDTNGHIAESSLTGIINC
jgi:hypothetical protein